MSNPFEAVWNMLKISIDTTNEPKSQLHIIEAGDCWTYLTLMVEFIRYEEAGLNTTTDDEVREMLNDVIQLCESQVQKLNAFMKKEGIPLPDASSAKPNSDPNDIPLGVKLTDDELANGVAFKLVTCLQACSKGQADSIRDDVGIMWLQFYIVWAMFGSTLKTLMRKSSTILLSSRFTKITKTNSHLGVGFCYLMKLTGFFFVIFAFPKWHKMF